MIRVMEKTDVTQFIDLDDLQSLRDQIKINDKLRQENQRERETNKQLQTKIDLITQQYESLKFQLAEMKRQLFGNKNERYIPPEQGVLFDLPDGSELPVEMEDLSFKRRKPRPKNHPHHIIPEDLPRSRIEYTLSLEERQCPCGCGKLLEKIGEIIHERIEVKPAELYVKQHVRFKYGGCPRDQSVLTADMPTLPIERGLAGTSLISQIAVDKYEYHQPLHRQQQRLARLGIKLNENSFYDWVCQAAKLLMPLYEASQRLVLKSPIVHTDDTPVKARLKGQPKTKNGYLWIYIGCGDNDIPVTAVYIYTEDRSSAGPQAFLGDYKGYVHADAYSGYDILFDPEKEDHPRLEVGCWMHARRGFHKIVKQSKKVGAAHQAMSLIHKLYRIEKTIKGMTPEERKAERQKESKPLLDQFKQWLDVKIHQALPDSPLYKAVQYCLNHWTALIRYIDDGRLEVDNGASERGIRPIALGRNNWISLGSHRGGSLAALFYSFIETCKIHEINSYEYFTDVLNRINDQPINKIHELLPYYWKQQQEQKARSSPSDG